MSDKFDMKLVIDAVTTPLLHARLSVAASYRERAAILRSLAECALRGAVQSTALERVGVPQYVPRSDDQNGLFAASPSAATARVETVLTGATDEDATGASNGVNSPYVSSHDANSHDVNLIADEFAAYLGG